MPLPDAHPSTPRRPGRPAKWLPPASDDPDAPPLTREHKRALQKAECNRARYARDPERVLAQNRAAYAARNERHADRIRIINHLLASNSRMINYIADLE